MWKVKHGSNVSSFEYEFSQYINCDHAAQLTLALLLLIALNYDVSGYEVIVPVQTFIATGMAVHLAGAIPVFADISPTTFSLSLSSIKEKLTSKTRGIIIVHFAGIVTPDYRHILDFCNEHNLFVIEDAAHAPGAIEISILERLLALAVFFPSKVITSAEGGMLTTNDAELRPLLVPK